MTPKNQILHLTKVIKEKNNSGSEGSDENSGGSTLSKSELLRAYKDMLRARLLDEKAIVLYKQNKCHFQIGCAGHEAVTTAVGHIFRGGTDWFYPYYRDLPVMVSLGMSNRDLLMNIMNKKDDPNSRGRQMPMHWGSKALNVVNQSSPTGTQLLQAVGCALAMKRKGLKEVAYVSLGEGTCSQGDFHEALNWAAREKLPVVFLVQNNEYAISVHISEQIAGQSVYNLVEGYEGLARAEIDGTDYELSSATLKTAHARALSGEGPTLIEAHVPRLQSHSISDNHLKYRTVEAISKDKSRCPVKKIHDTLLARKHATEAELTTIENEIKNLIDADSEWAETQADLDISDALTHNYVNPNPAEGVLEVEATGDDVYLVDAINHALHEEMTKNPNMYVFGQDVAHGKGGVFTVTTDLTAKFGKDRCFNAPLAEASIAGVAIGMATRGLKPVAEIQFGDYVWTAMMQIRNEMAMLNYRSGGEWTCPAVIRIPVGGYIHGGAYHSQSIEATFAHFPGLFVVFPSNATDAKGLLKSAIRGKDPVLFLEHKGLYRQVYAKGREGGVDDLTPIGKAKVVRAGTQMTIVSWGALVNKSTLAAKELEKEGYSVEVIDLRTIVPLDIETIFTSVRKTGRVLIAHEDVMFGGFGGEIAAQISDACFTSLEAPIKRIGMKYAAAVAHSGPVENYVLPQNEDVVRVARELLQF